MLRSPAVFDPGSLFVDLIVSSVGGALLWYGRKSQRWPQIVAGLLLMVSPYAAPTAGWMAATGAAIVIGLIVAIQLGW
ncbi:MAG TPA: hypothetical protein VG538_14505 [Vicinamibacterales bacterium]|nr:hypothetical protein [Vicinamibacterales bacterium]